jgi:hypothetical protein
MTEDFSRMIDEGEIFRVFFRLGLEEDCGYSANRGKSPILLGGTGRAWSVGASGQFVRPGPDGVDRGMPRLPPACFGVESAARG